MRVSLFAGCCSFSSSCLRSPPTSSSRTWGTRRAASRPTSTSTASAWPCSLSFRPDGAQRSAGGPTTGAAHAASRAHRAVWSTSAPPSVPCGFRLALDACAHAHLAPLPSRSVRCPSCQMSAGVKWYEVANACIFWVDPDCTDGVGVCDVDPTPTWYVRDQQRERPRVVRRRSCSGQLGSRRRPVVVCAGCLCSSSSRSWSLAT